MGGRKPVPSIIVTSEELIRNAEIMIDTGAEPNLIKSNFIAYPEMINNKIILKLTGITDEPVETMGQVKINISGMPIIFHVVDNKFPIAQAGILGSDFFHTHQAEINYAEELIKVNNREFYFKSRETVTIPARTNSSFYVKIANIEMKEGYIPRLNAGAGIFLGEALVTNNGGKAYLRVTNSRDEDIELIIPTVRLLPSDEAIPLSEFSGDESSDSQTKCSKKKSRQRKTIYKIEHQNLESFNRNCYESNEFVNKERSEEVLKLLRLEDLNELEKEHMVRLIEKHCERFHIPGEPLDATRVAEHPIFTTDDIPVHKRPYRLPPIHKEEILKQVKELKENKIIKPSVSPYSAPLCVVPKKPDSKGNPRFRMVIDYRGLNAKTVGDAYPLPNITEILDQLGSAKYFSIFDLASGFHQIKMKESDAHKTAFSTPYGHFEFDRMPFGLKNAPATFQRLMDRVLTGLQGTEMFVYLDDIVLYASSLEDHERKFNTLMERLKNANLKLQPDKCEFLKKEVLYLGHYVGRNGVRPDPKKLEAVLKFPTPTTVRKVREFLGLTGFYRRFVKHYAKIAKPLTNLLKKNVKFKWSELAEKAMQELKDILCSSPILQYPDFSKPFVLTTDASNYAIGGILSQGPMGKDLPIAYGSRVLNAAEQNYSVIEKEFLAILHFVKHYRPYLYGRKFTIVTDHQPLVSIHRSKDQGLRIVQWRTKLDGYEYNIIHKPGRVNANADALSRNPVEVVTVEQQILKIDAAVKERQEFKVKLVPDNLFNADDDYSLAHCVAQDLNMGAGIAIEFKKRFKQIDQLKNQRKRVGEVAYLKDKQRYIFYLITKKNSNLKPSVKDLEKSLRQLKILCTKLKCYKLAMPKIGCGLDQLSWEVVKEKIEKIFSKPFQIRIYTNEGSQVPKLSMNKMLDNRNEEILSNSQLVNIDINSKRSVNPSSEKPTVARNSVSIALKNVYPSDSSDTDHQSMKNSHKTKQLSNKVIVRRKLRDRNKIRMPAKFADYTLKIPRTDRNLDSGSEAERSDSSLSDEPIENVHSLFENSNNNDEIASLNSNNSESNLESEDKSETHIDSSAGEETIVNVNKRDASEGTVTYEKTKANGNAMANINKDPLSSRNKDPSASINKDLLAGINKNLISNTNKDAIASTSKNKVANAGNANAEIVINMDEESDDSIAIAQDQNVICNDDALGVQNNSHSDSESSVADENAQLKIDDLIELRKDSIIETRDKLSMQKGNNVFFVTLRNNPCDNGSLDLQEQNKLPEFEDLALGRAKVLQVGTKRYIALPIKESKNTRLDKEILINALKSLLDVVNTMRLDSIALSKTSEIDDISWKQIFKLLLNIFADNPCKITICNSLIRTPGIEDRKEIIREYHEATIGGHKGVTKTYKRVRERYYWPNMKNQIEEFVTRCEACQLKKLTRVKTKQPMKITDTPDESFDKIAMDIVGPLPVTKNGNQYILTIQDLLTKYSIGVPLKETTSTDVADALIKAFICKFGAPKYILTDQGRNLISALLRVIAKVFKIKQCKTTAFCPQSNGSLERSHHVLGEYLKQFYTKVKDWDEWVDLAMFSYNTSVHESTQFTPYELVFGKVARVPSNHEIEEDFNNRTYAEYLMKLNKKLRKIQALAKEKLIQAKERSKFYYDRKINPLTLKIGDLVYLLKEPKKGKLDDQYTGPHEVLEIFGNHNVKIKIGNKTKMVHSNKLKIAKKPKNL